MGNNSRFWICVRYQLKSMKRPLLIFSGIFIFLDVILLSLPSIIMATQYNNDLTGIRAALEPKFFGYLFWSVSSNYVFYAMIFIFVLAYITFKSRFNHLLTMNVTRSVQFWSGSVATLISTLILTICANIIGLLEFAAQYVTYFFSVNRDNARMVSIILESKDAPFNIADYAPVTFFEAAKIHPLFADLANNPNGWYIGELLKFELLIFAVLLISHLAGETIGILANRFKRAFTVPFWTVYISIIGSIYVLFSLFGLIALGTYLPQYRENFRFDLSLPILIMGILLVALVAVKYFAIRKMPPSA